MSGQDCRALVVGNSHSTWSSKGAVLTGNVDMHIPIKEKTNTKYFNVNM